MMPLITMDNIFKVVLNDEDSIVIWLLSVSRVCEDLNQNTKKVLQQNIYKVCA